MSSPSLPSTLRAAERKALDEFTHSVKSRFGERIRDLRLFGSRARGEGNEDSDLDVLVVIDGLSPAERREVCEETGDAMTQHDVILGALVLSLEHWMDLRDRERLIVKEIDRDGIPL